MGKRGQALSVLIVSTVAFTVCFMVWMMFGVIGIPIRKTLNLNATEFGLLTATPVLTGSLIRVPLGMWTDKYGGRIVLFVLMLACVVPIYLIAHATQYWQYLVLGLFVGLAGGSFSVGTPYVARWFPRNRQGFAMGVFGAGNSGAAVNKFVAPALIVAFGWAVVPQVYAADHARRGNPLLVRQLFRSRPPGRREGHLAAATGCVERSQGVEAVPVLLHRIWRLRGDEPLDGSVLHWRIWPRHTRCGIVGRMFLAARRRAARRGWVDFRQVWGAQRHMVGALGQLGLPVPALLSADRHDDPYDERSEDVPHRPQRLAVHDTHVRAWNRVGVRQGVGVQVHLRRLSDQHRRHFRCRRTCRGNGGVCVADHVWGADGLHRGALLGLHAAVWSGLGVADLDVLDRSAQHGAPWTAGRAVPPRRRGRSKSTKEGNEREQFNSHPEHADPERPRRISSTGAPRTTRSGTASARRSPTATSGYRFPRCCADSPSGECGGLSPCRCSTLASHSARRSFSR